MDQFLVNGPNHLTGTLKVSQAKNALLAILAATILSPKKIILKNLPQLRDIETMLLLLKKLGVKVGEAEKKNDLIIEADNISQFCADYELVRKMRASVLVLGPLLSRFGEAQVSLPGGCAIGTRPIDIHLAGLSKMGAKISVNNGVVDAKAPRGLNGAEILLPFPSVGATENLMMAAYYAKGEVHIENAAREPEIVDLARFLTALGLRSEGAGTSRIKIFPEENPGAIKFSEIEFEAIGDRIEAGTFVSAALITGSELTVLGFNPQHLESFLNLLETSGVKMERGESHVRILSHRPQDLSPISFDTAPFPGIPTDLQAQLLALATQLGGTSVISEQVFENRFMHVPELRRLGANIELKGRSAVVKGACVLEGAPVMCTDLRASAALVLASLVANGETTIRRVYHIDRGYERIDEKLLKLGANIKRERE